MKPWQYAPAPPQAVATAEPLSAAQEAELLYRHHLGFMDAKVSGRLEVLFAEPPADMTTRLTRACGHLDITGEHADLFASVADHWDALERLTERVGAGAWPIGNPEVLRDYLKRVRSGDAEALRPVRGYPLIGQKSNGKQKTCVPDEFS